ncbi:MAG TPA: hypothetical protein VF553_19865 [Pyrinomonadaceae bacterium]|jgi:hypothetical protein
MSLDLTKTTVIAGFVSFLLVFLITLIRHRRFDPSDFGSFAVGFLSGSNIPAALFLCYYVFDPDPPTLQSKLLGYEKYIAFAGLSFLFVNVATIISLCKKAWAKPDKAQ